MPHTEPKFEDILKVKRDYYGFTESAIQFAAEEYGRQLLLFNNNDASPVNFPDNNHGICKEKNCLSNAEVDYNGHGHWVCKMHFDSLNDYFDKEYN